MKSEALNERLALQVALALADQAPAAEITPLLVRASAAGFSRAEIAAVRAGRSFDVQGSAAIGLALALRAGDAWAAEQAHRRAKHLGLQDDEVHAISVLAQGPASAGEAPPPQASGAGGEGGRRGG